MAIDTLPAGAAKPVHIDDVVSYFGICSENFKKISAVLRAAANEMEGYVGGDDKLLIKAAREMAEDMCSAAEGWSDEVKDGGVRGGATGQIPPTKPIEPSAPAAQARNDIAVDALTQCNNLLNLIWREIKRGADERELDILRNAMEPRIDDLIGVALSVVGDDEFRTTEEMQAVVEGTTP